MYKFMIIINMNLVYTLHIFLQKKEKKKGEQGMKIRGFTIYAIKK